MLWSVNHSFPKRNENDFFTWVSLGIFLLWSVNHSFHKRNENELLAMLFNLLKHLWLYFSTYWKDSGYGFQLVENILAMVFNMLKKFWLCFSTCWKIYCYAFQLVEKILAMLFNLLKNFWLCFSSSEKFSWMVFRAWKVQKSLTVSLILTLANSTVFLIWLNASSLFKTWPRF